jgi:protein O-mannosyl-transferase
MDRTPLPSTLPFRIANATLSIRLALLIGTSILVYAPALFSGFVWDDASLLTESFPSGITGLGRIWFAPGLVGTEEHYWPVTYTVFWIQHLLWDGNPAGYHLVNLLLHALNAILVWTVARRVGVAQPLLGAALFAVHPIHVESVAWIIELKDLLSGALYLGAVLAWVRHRESGGSRHYWACIALFIAGMWAKSVVVTLPAALLLLEWWTGGRISRPALVRIASLFVIGAVLAALDFSLVHPEETASLGISLRERLLIAGTAVWFYATKLVAPVGLTAIYPKWGVGPGNALLLAAVPATLALLFQARHRIGRGPFATAAFYTVTLLPTLGIIPFSFMQHAYVADRYQYLASAVPLMAVPALLAAVASTLTTRPRAVAAGVVACALPVLAALTWHRTQAFEDTETFFRDALRHNENAWVAHMTLGTIEGGRGNWTEAEASFRRVLQIRPADAETRANLAVALVKLGRGQEALEELDRALEIKPSYERAIRLRRLIAQPGAAPD